MKKYLTLGSVVILKNGKKRLMIYGRRQIHAESKKIYDYVGCLYPEGNISAEYSFMFNNEDIEKVYFIGYEDEEENEFQKVLKSVDEDLKYESENETNNANEEESKVEKKQINNEVIFK